MKYLIFLPVFCLLLACDNTQQQDSDVSHSAMEVSALNYPDTAKGEAGASSSPVCTSIDGELLPPVGMMSV